jgi:hypothetical protein
MLGDLCTALGYDANLVSPENVQYLCRIDPAGESPALAFLNVRADQLLQPKSDRSRSSSVCKLRRSATGIIAPNNDHLPKRLKLSPHPVSLNPNRDAGCQVLTQSLRAKGGNIYASAYHSDNSCAQVNTGTQSNPKDSSGPDVGLQKVELVADNNSQQCPAQPLSSASDLSVDKSGYDESMRRPIEGDSPLRCQ